MRTPGDHAAVTLVVGGLNLAHGTQHPGREGSDLPRSDRLRRRRRGDRLPATSWFPLPPATGARLVALSSRGRAFSRSGGGPAASGRQLLGQDGARAGPLRHLSAQCEIESGKAAASVRAASVGKRSGRAAPDSVSRRPPPRWARRSGSPMSTPVCCLPRNLRWNRRGVRDRQQGPSRSAPPTRLGCPTRADHRRRRGGHRPVRQKLGVLLL